MSIARDFTPLHDQDLAGLIDTFRLRRAYLRAEMAHAGKWFYDSLRHTAVGLPFPYFRYEVPGAAHHPAIEPGPLVGPLPCGSRTALTTYEDRILKRLSWRMPAFRRSYDAATNRYKNTRSWQGTWPSTRAPDRAWIAHLGPSRNQKATYREQQALADDYIRKFDELSAMYTVYTELLTQAWATLESLRKTRRMLEDLHTQQPWLEVPLAQRTTRHELSGAIERYAMKMNSNASHAARTPRR